MSISTPPALPDWLWTNFPPARGPVRLRQLHGGQSNPTFALETSDTCFVLRTKPAGPLLPSAHAVEREYRVLAALADSGVPVPRVFALCEDASIVGAPFFIMEYLDGRVFADPALPNVAPAERTAMYESALGALAALHAVDIEAAGLAGFGRADGYLRRQVVRWTQQYRATQTAEVAAMEALIDWLPANVPSSADAAIAHGDYRLGNLMFAADQPRVIGILDWELSTIGDPLLDLAYAVLMHFMPADVVRGMGGSVALAGIAGIPDASTLIAHYHALAGRDIRANLTFYLALGFFRSAAIMQGIRRRIALGNAAGGAAAERHAAIAPRLAELGWACAQGRPA